MVEIKPLMNSHDQATRQVRLVAMLILGWGVYQAMTSWPYFKYVPDPSGHGGMLHQYGPRGLVNIVAGAGLFSYWRFGRTLGLFFARLRVIGCLLDLLDLVFPRFSVSPHVLQPMSPTVEKLLIGPFLIAQAYIIWVLTRDDVIARFKAQRASRLPVDSAAGAL